MAPVTIRDVKKAFGSVPVIGGVDVAIDDGQFVVLVAPSGCGKSPLLRMIAGLESVSDGEIRINDRLVNTVAPKDRDVAMVFQSYALYPHRPELHYMRGSGPQTLAWQRAMQPGSD
jgi:multiple sugar transport system ATP-binding protein